MQISNEAFIVNTVMERIAPWHRVEWVDVDRPVAKVLGELVEFSHYEDEFGVRSVERRYDPLLDRVYNVIVEQTYQDSRIEKLLNGWVRDDAGELVQHG